jgi:hypothetical protein
VRVQYMEGMQWIEVVTMDTHTDGLLDEKENDYGRGGYTASKGGSCTNI